MIAKETVFIIGAGSGYDINMPLGVDLADKISQLTNIDMTHNARSSGNKDILAMLVQLARQDGGEFSANRINQLHKSAREISQGIRLCDSIDDYVNIHQSDGDIVKIAKIAIAKSILDAERSSIFFNEKNNMQYIDFTRTQGSWYTRMFRMLTHGLAKESAKYAFENVTFINFNYDRCLEQYLAFAMSRLYTMDIHVAVQIVSQARIYHPYGQIGYLPGFGDGRKVVRFGGDAQDSLESLRISGEINTYAENISDKELSLNIKNAVRNARQIIVLGFGFHEQNMKILEPDQNSSHSKVVFATAMRISPPNLKIITDNIAKQIMKHMFVPDTNSIYAMRDMDCSGILNEYDLLIRSARSSQINI